MEFPEYGVEVAVGSLLTHCQIQHSMGRGEPGGESHPPPIEAQTYRVSFPKHLLQLGCAVVGYLGGASSWTNLRIHFAHRHVQDTIVIL